MFPNRKPIDREKRNLRFRSRNGAAVVEAAICIPMIIILMFGTLEICAGFYLKESLTIAAYEGARTGAKRGATVQDVRDRVNNILNARNVNMNGGSIQIRDESGNTLTDLADLAALEPFSVSVAARSASNSAFVFNALANRQISGTVTIAREFDTPKDDEDE
jgi:Flp pilus assembly protein TadG